MAFSIVASVGTGSTDGQNVTSAPINTTGADLIVVFVCCWIWASTDGITDSEGNTWVAGSIGPSPIPSMWGYVPFGQPGDFYCQQVFCWICRNPNTSATHTFTKTTSGIFPLRPSIHVLAVSGVYQSGSVEGLNSPYDDTVNYTNGAKTTTLGAGARTPSEDDCLCVSFLGSFKYRTSVLTPSGGLPMVGGVLPVINQTMGGGITYQIQTTAAEFDPTFSWTTDDYALAMTVVFSAESGAPPPPPSTGSRRFIAGLGPVRIIS